MALLTDEEKAQIAENSRRRKMMVDSAFEDGVPTVKNFRVINEIMTSSDDALLKMAKLRQASDAADKMEAATRVGADILSAIIGAKREASVSARTDLVAPDTLIPETVPGELDVTAAPLNVDKFFKD